MKIADRQHALMAITKNNLYEVRYRYCLVIQNLSAPLGARLKEFYCNLYHIMKCVNLVQHNLGNNKKCMCLSNTTKGVLK
jgi:hypothetical protein